MLVAIVSSSLPFLAGVVVWHLRLRVAMRPCAVRGAAAEDVSIVIPARDEAHNLPALLASLDRLDPAPREILVVDDHSRDGTGEVARRAGVQVVVPPPLPSGWNGKPWACAAGARIASGDTLLFTDADTVHAPDSLARASAHRARTGADLLSVIPTHLALRTWERLQGVFHLLLLVATSAGARSSSGERRFTIGQYLLISREAYDAIGGHAAVAARIAEDLALGRAVVESGRRAETLFAPGLLCVRMYPEGLAAFVRGWRRSFVEGLASAGPRAALEITLVHAWLLGAPLGALHAAAVGAPLDAAVGAVFYLGAVASVARRQRSLGAFPSWTSALYPLFVVVFAAVSVLALVDRWRGARVVWKGRDVISASTQRVRSRRAPR